MKYDIGLENKIWQELKGGYKMPYDASIPLRKLEQANAPEEINKIFQELWNELHHQGDVGIASYLAVPQLARIGIIKNLFDWNIFGLCVVIETVRNRSGNPILPPEYEGYYKEGLANLKKFALANINKDMDDETYGLVLSVLAISTGRIKLGKAIMELAGDDDVLNEFLEQF